MKTTCLVNSFNYSNFVVEAVESVLKQSVSFDEIIVVDDGSTDNSVQVLKENFYDEFSDLGHLSDLAYLEFATIPTPQLEEFLSYLQLIISSRSNLLNKLWSFLSITRYFLENGNKNV